MMYWLDKVGALLRQPVFDIGATQMSFPRIVTLLAMLWLLVWLARRISRILEAGLNRRSEHNLSLSYSVSKIVRYSIVIVGAFAILQNFGVDLSTFSLLAGALGVGLGFGMRDIISNFVSGVAILFEQPIKVGDRIEVDQVLGDVIRIGARSTHVRTNDNITIIIPNAKLISDNVTNWTMTERLVRFKIPITMPWGVSYQEIEQLLVECLSGVADVAKDPAPGVRLLGFGDDGLKVEVRAWTTSLVHHKGTLTSLVNQAIYEALLKAGIEQSYPRRQIHVGSGTDIP